MPGSKGYEKDAMVSLAGYAADGTPVDRQRDVAKGLTSDTDSDLSTTAMAILRIVYLVSGNKPLPKDGKFKVDKATIEAVLELYGSIAERTASLVKEFWPAITCVAKHLESHDIDALPGRPLMAFSGIRCPSISPAARCFRPVPASTGHP